MRALRLFGTQAVRLTGPPAAVREMRRLWAPFDAEDAGPHPDDLRLEVTDAVVASAELNRAAVAVCPYPAVHAGVTAWRGGAIVTPAASGAGKSTLTTALVLAGATYVSDEALVMTDNGAALPYPKPVALSLASLSALGLPPRGPSGASPQGEREHLLAAADLGAVVDGVTPVRHVVLGAWDPTATEVSLRPAPRRRALAALLELGFNHYRDPAVFLRTAAAVVTGSQTWLLQYGDVRRAAGLMADVLP